MNSPLPLLWQARDKAYFSFTALDAAVIHKRNYVERQGVRLEKTIEAESGLTRLDLITNHLPVEISLCLGMALHMLRSALDTAIFTLMQRAGAKSTSRLAFPMHETEEQLRATFNDGKRTCPKCKHETTNKGNHAELGRLLPGLEDMIFQQFRPWKDGNYLIWALGKLDNIDKHRMIVPTFGEILWRGSWNAISSSGGGTWNEKCSYQLHPGQTRNLARTDGSIVIKDPGVFSFQLVFENGLPLGGVPIFEAAKNLTQAVFCILDALEAKFR